MSLHRRILELPNPVSDLELDLAIVDEKMNTEHNLTNRKQPIKLSKSSNGGN